MDKTMKNRLLLITYAVAIFFAFQNIHIFGNILGKITSILMPFIYGFAISYIVSWPIRFFSKKFFTQHLHNEKAIKILSISSGYLLLFGVFITFSMIIIPQIIVSVNQLIANSSNYINSFKTFLENIIVRLHVQNTAQIEKIADKVIDFVSNEAFLTKVFDTMKNFALVTYNWVVGVIVSFYYTFNKEDLLRKMHKLSKVCLNSKWHENITNVLEMSHNIFGQFLIGKIIDSFIIGFLCFIGTTFLAIPYSLLISVIVGFTNIIPFFGPFLGAIPCILMLLVINPVKALWFAIFILVLQQIDGNIIGPKILGNSIGISAIFIMLSVILGGGLFGVPGMILGVPVFVVFYNLVATFVNKDVSKDSIY